MSLLLTVWWHSRQLRFLFDETLIRGLEGSMVSMQTWRIFSRHFLHRFLKHHFSRFENRKFGFRLELALNSPCLNSKNTNSTPSLHFRWQHVLKNTLLKSISLLLNVWRRSRKLRFHPDDTPTLRVAWRGYPCRLGPFPQTCFCIGFCDATSEFLDTTSALWPQNYQTLTPQMTPQVGLHLEFTLNSHWTQTYTNPTSGLHFRCQSVLKKALLKSISLLLNVWCGGVRENYVSVFTKHPFWKLEGGLHAELACFIQAFFAQVSAMSSQLPWSPHWTPNKHTYLFAPKATFQVPAWII